MAGTLTAPFRIRTYRPKTRSGCKTCKIRKVKCDETKPHCKRCTTTGRTCDGYDPNFVPSRATVPVQALSTSPSSSASSGDDPNHATETRPLQAPSFLLPLLRLESDNERISLQFYVKHAGPALAQSSNSAFWQRQLLQAAHQHASIQHCIIALGAMYRSFFDATPARDKHKANRNYHFALTQSNKAIQQLIQDQTVNNRSEMANKLTAMTCCVLFGSMANLQGQREAALKHLRSGIRMLKETKLQTYTDLAHPVNIFSLRSIFTGLDIQARSSMSWTDVQTWEPVMQATRPSEPLEIDTTSPWALSEIHHRLETLLNDTLAFNRSCVTQPPKNRPSIQHSHNTLVTRFTHITTAFSTLHNHNLTPNSNPNSNSNSTPNPTTSKTKLLLAQAHHWLRSSITPLKHHFNIDSPLATIPYNPISHFEEMMPHIEYLLSLTEPSVPVYAAAPGPLSALWLICVSAPASCVALRKKALGLIQQLPRREGLFDAQLAGRIGAVAWELEQAAAREEAGVDAGLEGERDLVVPEHLRLVYMDVEYARDEEGRATVKLANGVQLMRGEATVVDIEF